MIGNQHIPELEVAALDLHGTSLVVVSACQSASGQASYADGLSGLQRSLTLAGARSEILSLWSVRDQETARFMTDFYAGIKRGQTKSEALRETRIAAWKRGSPPGVRAAFVLYGDPGKL